MMNNVWLSIIIPVYNTEKYISNCLKSIVNQYSEGIEIICINDGSTDDSLRLLKNYALEYNYIIVIEQKNMGVSIARNTGISEAKGEYIIFLDSDDMLDGEAIVTIKTHIDNNNLDVLMYDAKCIFESEELEKDESKETYYARKREYGGPYSGRLMFCILTKNDDLAIAVWNMCIRRELITENNLMFQPGIIYEDFLFLFDILMHASLVKHIHKPLVKYRVRRGSIMTSPVNKLNVDSYVYCVKKMLSYLLTNKLDEELENAISRITWQIISTAKRDDIRIKKECRLNMKPVLGIEGLLQQCMGIGSQVNQNFDRKRYLNGFIKALEEANSIVIYGAGKIGRMAYSYITKCGYHNKVESFAVSVIDENMEKCVMGVVVDEINKISDKTTLVIIATAGNNAVDMHKMAVALGFHNIEKIDYILEKTIEGELSDNEV